MVKGIEATGIPVVHICTVTPISMTVGANRIVPAIAIPHPLGNPDHIESSNATRYGEYSIKGVNDLTAETYETAHGGYDPSYANQDADRVLPVDVLRDLEKEGKIGKLYDYFFTTVGNGTAVASAKKFSEEIGAKLKKDHVDAVILTST